MNTTIEFFTKLWRHLVRKLIREACGFTLLHYPDEADEPRRKKRCDDEDEPRLDDAIEIVQRPRAAGKAGR